MLLRARAIETQCWIAAPATWGKHCDGTGEPRFTYGHSLVCDPWGHVVAKVSDGIGWATARDRPARHRAGAPRHAGAGAPEARLTLPPAPACPAAARDRRRLRVSTRIAFAAAPTALAQDAAPG